MFKKHIIYKILYFFFWTSQHRSVLNNVDVKWIEVNQLFYKIY